MCVLTNRKFQFIQKTHNEEPDTLSFCFLRMMMGSSTMASARVGKGRDRGHSGTPNGFRLSLKHVSEVLATKTYILCQCENCYCY